MGRLSLIGLSWTGTRKPIPESFPAGEGFSLAVLRASLKSGGSLPASEMSRMPGAHGRPCVPDRPAGRTQDP